MKILILTRYGQQGASSRLRSYQFFPYLFAANIKCVSSSFFSDELLISKYNLSKYRLIDLINAYYKRINILLTAKNYDLIWIEKEALPWLPAWFEKWLLKNVKYTLDFDDAIFHNYDLTKNPLLRYFFWQRIDILMKSATLITVGNTYLANRAIDANAKNIEIIPTVIDITRYSSKLSYSFTKTPIIVWIGSPTSLQYLLIHSKVFELLALRHKFILRVIGGGNINITGVEIESLPWSLETETSLIVESDIGIMPLRDTPWEQGKCAYKLIQYMACGLPTVASPIGANKDVMIENVNGYFASTTNEWVDKLDLLLSDIDIRERFGKANRIRVETNYCLQQIAPKLVYIIKNIT